MWKMFCQYKNVKQCCELTLSLYFRNSIGRIHKYLGTKYQFLAFIWLTLYTRCIGKSTSGKKYQVGYGTFSLGKSTILVLFPIGTFSLKNRKKYHIDLLVILIVCIILNSQISAWTSFPKKWVRLFTKCWYVSFARIEYLTVVTIWNV